MTELAVLREHALAIYRAALAGADPAPPLRVALDELPPSTAPLRIIAIGKAASAMAAAALAAAAATRRAVAGGLVVGVEGTTAPPGLSGCAGDHRVPARRSRAAARAVAEIAAAVREGDETWVLLSGGASSLIAAPIDDIPEADFETAWELLYRAGLPIGDLNLVRKRLTRWGAGRLAAALAAGTVRSYALSDVPGDDPASIGSGPCDPDPAKASDVRRLLALHGMLDRLPLSVREHLSLQEQGERAETPKPDLPVFRDARTRIIAGNATALDAAGRCAADLGYTVRPGDKPLTGEAAVAGVRLAEALLAIEATRRVCLLWGGETVVTLRPDSDAGRGGRAQELALAAAGLLERRPSPGPVALLAGSTDGRDGPTDAAGALVDAGTWGRARDVGADPLAALARHDSYRALEAAGDLVRTGPTGTNVMDVVIGLMG